MPGPLAEPTSALAPGRGATNQFRMQRRPVEVVETSVLALRDCVVGPRHLDLLRPTRPSPGANTGHPSSKATGHEPGLAALQGVERGPRRPSAAASWRARSPTSRRGRHRRGRHGRRSRRSASPPRWRWVSSGFARDAREGPGRVGAPRRAHGVVALGAALRSRGAAPRRRDGRGAGPPPRRAPSTAPRQTTCSVADERHRRRGRARAPRPRSARASRPGRRAGCRTTTRARRRRRGATGRCPARPSIHAGSDHGPAGSVAVTTKLPCRPSPPTSVQATKNRPSWCRIVGAKSPPDAATVDRSSWSSRCTACPTSSHSTRSRDRCTGSPGKYSKVEVTTKNSSPTRQMLGSGWQPGSTGLRSGGHGESGRAPASLHALDQTRMQRPRVVDDAHRPDQLDASPAAAGRRSSARSPARASRARRCGGRRAR